MYLISLQLIIVENPKQLQDLYFVFSNFEQREKFSNLSYSRLGVYIRSIVLDSSLLSLKSQVVVKKFFGLKKLMKDYEYLSIIDSESLFIKKCNYYKLFNNIWESRNCLISNYSLDGFFNLERCYKTLGI